jgi:DNA modification methylase
MTKCRLICGDVIKTIKKIPDNSVHCVVTSPPYFGLRNYGHEDQVGSEKKVIDFINKIVEISREIRRILHPSGTYWINIGDSYCKQKSDEYEKKNLMMVPAKTAISLQYDGWLLRSQMPWIRRNITPESVEDRPTSSVEYVYMLTKSEKYFYDYEAVKTKEEIIDEEQEQPQMFDLKQDKKSPEFLVYRRFRDSDLFFKTWEGMICDEEGPSAVVINPKSIQGNFHPAIFPLKFVEPFVKASTSEKGCCPLCGNNWKRITKVIDTIQYRKKQKNTKMESCSNSITETVGWEQDCSCEKKDPVPCVVFDPFTGSGTTAIMSAAMGRDFIGTELNPEYMKKAADRIHNECGLLTEIKEEY